MRRGLPFLVAILAAVTLHARADPIPVASLPVIKDMPDPLVMADGAPVKTPDQWRARREEMKKILEEIQSGKFVQEFMGGNKEGLERLKELRANAAKHPIEKVGDRLRSMMPWIGKNKLVDKNRN